MQNIYELPTLLSSSQIARRRRKAATFRKGEINAFSICRPPGVFANLPPSPVASDVRVAAPLVDTATPICTLSGDTFILDSSELVSSLESLVTLDMPPQVARG